MTQSYALLLQMAFNFVTGVISGLISLLVVTVHLVRSCARPPFPRSIRYEHANYSALDLIQSS